MSYLHETTLYDFDEMYRYGRKATEKELKQFDRLVIQLANYKEVVEIMEGARIWIA